MATPLSFQMVKTGGFASPDFSGFAHVDVAQNSQA
jgi:hypothetical protein